MSELAFNINGEAFEVPAHAAGWRVRKMRAKGSPEVVHAREGQPFVLPISAEIDELRAADDARLPARHPMVINEEELEDESEADVPAPPSGFDLNAIVAQLAPMLITNIMSGKLKVPGLGSMLDWRKATPDADRGDERATRTR